MKRQAPTVLLSTQHSSLSTFFVWLDDLMYYHKIYKTNSFSYLQKGIPLYSPREGLILLYIGE